MFPTIISSFSLKRFQYPFYTSTVSAGFPSPAEDHIEAKLDLNELLIKHPAATFFMRVSGNNMAQAGIQHNDVLVIDRSIKPRDGKIVVAIIAGQFTVRYCRKTKNGVALFVEKDGYAMTKTSSEEEVAIWGVVTSVIHFT
jgi:DNA polymerase V